MNEQLFKPRNIQERIEELDPLSRKMLTEFTRDNIIFVYVQELDRYVKALVLEEPNDEIIGNAIMKDPNKRYWSIFCKLYIKKSYVEENDYYGTYITTCHWYHRQEKWRATLSGGRWDKLKLKEYTKYEEGKY